MKTFAEPKHPMRGIRELERKWKLGKIEDLMKAPKIDFSPPKFKMPDVDKMFRQGRRRKR